MVRFIKDIKRELIHLEHKYQTLAIKTVDYVEIKHRLQVELSNTIKAANKDTAQEMKGYKPSKRPSFASLLKDRNEPAMHAIEIDADEEYDSAINGDIRN